DVGRNQVAAGTQKLSQLDEGGTQLFQSLAQAHARGAEVAGLFHGENPAAQGNDVGKVQLVDEIAEAVAQEYLGDLPVPPQLAIAEVQGRERHEAHLPAAGARAPPWPAAGPAAAGLPSRLGEGSPSECEGGSSDGALSARSSP